MPFSTSSSAPETSTTPLADYFWIAGVDGSEVLDTFRKLGDEYRNANATSPGPAVADIIEEDAEAENAHDAPVDGLSRSSSVIGPRSSYQRLSFRLDDPEPIANANGTHSNRSSVTIKGNSSGGPAPSPRASQFLGLEDFDFDKALVKFASERDSFLSDLSLSAGAITPASRPRSRLRTQKIESDEPRQSGLLRSSIGSVRRHMSFRDTNSMKRQPSLARQCGFSNLCFGWC